MNHDQIAKRRIAALKTMTLSELNAKFRELFGYDAPRSNVVNLRARLAWKIQEHLLGTLADADLHRLKELADADPLANLSEKRPRKNTVLQGTRYERVWNGKTYQVTVRGDGAFEYEGEVYRSLSAIADKITGTHWNGKKFFGVR